MTTTPALFVGHGSPMNSLESNRFTQSWELFARRVGTPRAILAISAHWFINASAVTAMDRPRTIHDFFGFPEQLFNVQYPATGSPELAGEVADVAQPMWVGLDHDSWGIDHGTWSVLMHMYPDASIPVVQLSIDASKPVAHHLELGARLAPLRDRGVLIVASGNVVHNLALVHPQPGDRGFDWAERFDDAARETMTSDPASLATLVERSDYALAAPTPDHFLPLAYLAGLAGAAGEKAEVLVEGHVMGSLSMTSYTIGVAS